MTAKQHGAHCAKLGYSVHYNPYRHKGSPEDYADWELGWLSI